MKPKDNKQRLFEIMGKLDNTFKPKLNEEIIKQQGAPEESKQIANILLRDPTKVMHVNLTKLQKPEIEQLLNQHPDFGHNEWFLKYTKNAMEALNEDINPAENKNEFTLASTENEPVHFELDNYRNNGALAVELVTAEGESWAMVSVNLPESDKLPKDEFFLKDWTENENIAKELIIKKLIIPTGKQASIGARSYKINPANNAQNEEVAVGDSYKKIKNDFPGHAKYVNPIDSPQYKWYQRVLNFMNGNNNVNEKAELAIFFQNYFLGMDYDILQTPAETVSWWLSPEQQEFISGEMNTNGSPDGLNETGEWSDDEEGVAWKESLKNEIEEISNETNGKLKLIDVRGFDKYQGPYAIVDIEGKRYKVWTMEEQGQLWIEDYPVDNTSGEGTKAGFAGNASEIIQMLGKNPTDMVTSKDFKFNLNEDSDFQELQRKIHSGEVWLDYYAPSDSEEYTDGQTFYNKSGQQLRNPEEYNPYSDGYTPFGDEG